MKIMAIFLLSACMAASANGHSQQITLSEKDAPLQQVFEKIEKQSGYTFAYTDIQLAIAKKVSIEVRNESLEKVLKICFTDQPFSYTIIEKTIVVKPKQEIPSEAVITKTNIGIDISGRITDDDGNGLQGASVHVKGTSIGTSTDANGYFKLSGIAEDAVLEISFVGFEKRVISIASFKANNNVLAIKRSENPLDAVQVIAYGQTSKRLSTGNISSVSASDIAKQPVNNPLLALQGRVPGLFITQSTGFAGSGIKVRIQGQNSISNGNDPLYVIDGVPFVTQLLPSINTIFGTGGGRLVNNLYASNGNPLNFINPADIESIDVLKDADATAIYGSQAANGAILITTKKGKAGEQKIEFNLQQGWGKVTRKMDLLNTRQYLDMRYEALKNDGISLSSLDQTANYDLTVWDTTRATDWQKVLIGNTAQYTDLQATVSGGNSNNSYSIGAGYHRETVVIPGDFNDQKATMHFQITSTSSNQKFRVSLTGNYMVDVNKLPNTASVDLTDLALRLSPVAPPLYNPDGTLNWAYSPAGKTTWDHPGNPMAQLLNKYTGKSNNLVSNVLLSYQLIPGLKIKSSLGYSNLQTNEIVTLPLSAVIPERRATTSNAGLYGNNNINSWIIEPQATYEKNIAKGKLEALIGSTIQQRNSSAQKLVGVGYISDDVLDDIRAASSVRTEVNLRFTYKYTALFGRINYNWQNKYIFNITARRDGSSRFGENNKFHNFASIAGAWIFSEEKFTGKYFSFLSFGKIKASYGTTGSDQIGEYQYLSTYFPVNAGNPYQGINTLQSNGLSNPYLQWEETRKLYIGLDLGFLKDRILVNANYYHNRSSNQLLGYALPVTTGFGGITKNFPATVQNTGLEFAVNTTNIENKKFKWSTSVNFTLPKNKLIAFPGLASSSYANTLIEGQPITIDKKFHFLGVDPTTGVYYFDSKTNPFNPKSPDDATVIVNTSPAFYGGVQNSLSYSGFALDFLFQFVKQKGTNYFFGRLPGASQQNQPVYVLDRWQKPGDVASHQRFNADYGLSNSWSNITGFSDAGFDDASYIRLKNISLSWQAPEKLIKKMHIHGLRIYTQAQNLLTFTKYKGLDPETLSSSTLPPLRVLTVGAQITL